MRLSPVYAWCLGAALLGGEQGSSAGRDNRSASGSAGRSKRPSLTVGLGKISFPSWKDFETTNGLRIMLHEGHDVPVVTIRIAIARGLAQGEDNRSRAIASAALDMLRGTLGGRYQSGSRDRLEALGSELIVGSDRLSDTVLISGSGLSDTAEAFIATAVKAIMTPDWSRADVERSITRIATAQRPNNYPFESVDQALYATLCIPGGFTKGEMGKPVTVESVLEWVKEHYRMDRVVLGVTGDVTRSQTLRAVDRVGGPHGARSADIGVATTKQPQCEVHDKVIGIKGKGPGDISITVAARTLGRSSPDYGAIVLIDRLLGSASLSRLRTELRENTGLSYDIASQLLPVQGGDSIWRLSGSVSEPSSEEAITRILRELGRLRTTLISDSELTSCKRAWIGEVALSFEKPLSLLRYRMDDFLGLAERGQRQMFLDRLVGVSPADVLRVAQKTLRSDRLTVVVAGPERGVDRVLAAARVALVSDSVYLGN